MDDIHFYEPTRGHGLRHDPLAAIVGPRPIGWISTVDQAGRANPARPILRGGGPADYYEVSKSTLFQMRRPA